MQVNGKEVSQAEYEQYLEQQRQGKIKLKKLEEGTDSYKVLEKMEG